MIAIKRKRSSNSVAQRMLRCPAELLSDAEEIGVIIADVDRLALGPKIANDAIAPSVLFDQ